MGELVPEDDIEITAEMIEAGRSIVEAWAYDSPSLEADGWRVFTVWGCQLAPVNLDDLYQLIVSFPTTPGGAELRRETRRRRPRR